jgi:hypothetical protein
LIVVIVGLAVYFIFNLVATKLGAPSWLMQALGVLVLVVVAIFALRWLGSLL